jgi:DNA-binding response OmpR family regulator
VFTTARAREEDIVQALSSGADDYLIKPLRQNELMARLSALWRRAGNHRAKSLQLGPIELDLVNQQARLDGEAIKLTPTEFSLATCMVSRVGQLLSREFLLKEVWGVDACIDTRTVDMHVCRLRKLLQIGPEAGLCINTVYRHGYRLEQL